MHVQYMYWHWEIGVTLFKIVSKNIKQVFIYLVSTNTYQLYKDL
jgi:hypothetical protein